jgi:hypothetical protein
MSNERDRITVPEMAEAINRSGYLLEQRVSAVLAEQGYYVEANPAYPDPVTGKSREFDISAMAAVRLARNQMDFIFPVVLSECENNEQPMVFFCSEPQVPFLFYQEVKCSGVPVQIWTGKKYVRLQEFLGLEKFHHYCDGPVATQYCSFHRKNQNSPWIALHSDAHHETFTSLISALESTVDEHYSSWTLPTLDEEEPANVQVYYPVIVLQGELYRAQERRRKLVVQPCQHVQYRKEIWSAHRHSTYQIDVVTERHFPLFLELIDREIETMARRLKRHRAAIRDSANRIIGTARRLRRSKISWREIFEPR